MRLFAGTPFDQPPKCERCGALTSVCTCPPERQAFLPPEKQTARLSVEKRKKGKVVTLVKGLTGSASDLPALLTRLKSACGAGGTLKDEVLELQGEHLNRIGEVMKELGYRVKP